ncbi:hypothetical protein ACFO3J_30115 [Streptomyces polygonati]|uniref:IclR-ED domain-containing protein n=1 Tax=Streptomyces polygonati TaxID=1617087 RepID=A0ABV8HXN1_9ACTN
MDEERVGRLVSELQGRRVMAHVERTGVYECGIRVVLDKNVEAIWDLAGAGLDAEIVSDGVLIGFVPHVEGSEEFTDAQIVDCIATTRYSLEGLHASPRVAAEGKSEGIDTGPRAQPVSPPADAPHHGWADRLRRGRGRHS